MKITPGGVIAYVGWLIIFLLAVGFIVGNITSAITAIP